MKIFCVNNRNPIRFRLRHGLYLYLCLICGFLWVPTETKAEADTPKGLQLLHIGNNAQSISLGGAFSTETTSIEGLTAAPLKQVDLLSPYLSLSSMGFGSSKVQTYGFTYSHPTPYGVISLIYSRLSLSDVEAPSLEAVNSVYISFAKALSKHHSFGAKWNIDSVTGVKPVTPFY